MSNVKDEKKSKGKDWKADILEFLAEKPSGFTITDIADNIHSTRITVSKYLSLLEQEKKVLSKEIGVYKLYFSAERRYMAIDLFRAYYKSLLRGVKDKFSDKKDFKEIGVQVSETLSDFLLKQFPKSIRDQIHEFKDFLKFFGSIYPYLDFIYADNLTIQETIDFKQEKAIYVFKNTGILDITKDLKYHFYILSGIIEKSLSRIFKKNTITCNVSNVNRENKTITLMLESN